MKLSIQILLIFCISFAACKSKNHHQHHHTSAGHSSMPDSSATTEVKLDTSRFMMVSFFSIGAGTDGKTRAAFLSHIEQYQQSHQNAIALSSKAWGREGEIDYCVDMTKLSSSELKEFKNTLSEILYNKELVRVKYESACVLKK